MHEMIIGYPYGYSNDVYDYIHVEFWNDYRICGGSSFIELIDAFVGEHIPA